MRNPDRLDLFYDEVKRIHKQYFPDWRFGQLMANFIEWFSIQVGLDIFYQEEDSMLKYLQRYADIYGIRRKA